MLEVPLELAGSGAQAIPLLRKIRTGFRSSTVLCGGFMPLRSAGQEAAVLLDRPALIATDDGVPIQQLHGDAVRSLPARAKRRLLSISLTEGRRVPLGVDAKSSGFLLFLSLELPSRQLVTTWPRYGIGAVTRDGGSFAVIEPRFAGRNRTIGSMRLYGADGADELLLSRVREWDRRSRPTESELEIRIGYDEQGNSRLRYRWAAD